jgi:hypothetical protein
MQVKPDGRVKTQDRWKVSKLAQPIDSKEIVSIEELTISNMYEIEALIEVLVKKEIVR